MLNLFAAQDAYAGPMIYFAHIGKTAGTSFRHAAVASLGAKRCAALYTESHKGADKKITELFFSAYDKSLGMKQNKSIAKDVLLACEQREISFFSTHHNALFKRVINPSQVVTFVREPLARLISHYNFSLSRGWTDPAVTFEEFAMQRHLRNLQSRSLPMKRFEEIGFIGLTERYEESLAVFNEKTGANFKFLKKNKTKKTPAAIVRSDIASETVQKIKDHHATDFALYDLVCKNFAVKSE